VPGLVTSTTSTARTAVTSARSSLPQPMHQILPTGGHCCDADHIDHQQHRIRLVSWTRAGTGARSPDVPDHPRRRPGIRASPPGHPPRVRPELVAHGPSEVWSWDITALKGPAKGIWYKCYVILDIFSRYVAGWLVAAAEDAVVAKDFLADAIARNGCEPHTIHVDRGGRWCPNRCPNSSWTSEYCGRIPALARRTTIRIPKRSSKP
jgi:transposase InsO family protein